MRLWTISLTLVIAQLSIAQSLETFEYLGDKFSGYGYLGVALSHSRIQNEVVPRPDRHNLRGNFAEFNYKHQDFRIGKGQYDIRAKMYTDVFRQFLDIFNETESAYSQAENSALSTGPLGWHTFALNVAGTDKVLFSPGFHLNDYFIFANVRDIADVDRDNPQLTTYEPQGYYFGAGPSALFSVLTSKYLLINVKTQYSMTYWRPVNVSQAVVDDEYPKPHIFGLTTEFLTPLGVYFEIDHNRLLNRGDIPNSTIRTDFNLGFKFVKDNG